MAVSDAVGGDLKTIFDKSDQPTDDDHLRQGRLFVFQMPVPGHRHEDVGHDQKNDRRHFEKMNALSSWRASAKMSDGGSTRTNENLNPRCVPTELRTARRSRADSTAAGLLLALLSRWLAILLGLSRFGCLFIFHLRSPSDHSSLDGKSDR